MHGRRSTMENGSCSGILSIGVILTNIVRCSKFVSNDGDTFPDYHDLL
jgi:hypothetical protein